MFGISECSWGLDLDELVGSGDVRHLGRPTVASNGRFREDTGWIGPDLLQIYEENVCFFPWSSLKVQEIEYPYWFHVATRYLLAETEALTKESPMDKVTFTYNSAPLGM